jgi:hypothetical protein
MADKNKSVEYYKRPEKLGAWEGTKQFLYNKETSECMGRNSGSWGKQNNLMNVFCQENFPEKENFGRILAPLHC